MDSAKESDKKINVLCCNKNTHNNTGTTDTNPEQRQQKTPSVRSKNLKNKIVPPKEASNTDPFVRTKIAFHLDGPERPEWLASNDFVPYGKTVGAQLYLLGI